MRIPVILSIALAYVGTVIGAGFASGQEVWYFFSRFGSNGIWGILVATAIFAVAGGVALDRGREGMDNFGTLLAHTYPSQMAKIFEGMTDAFLILGLIVCTSGGASTLAGFGVTSWAGRFVTLGTTLLLSYSSSTGITRVNLVVVPCLVTIIVMTSLLVHPIHLRSPEKIHSWFWLLSAILYVSYNLFTAAMVLLGLGNQTRSQREAWIASVIGAMILGTLLFTEHRILRGLDPLTNLPMVVAAFRIHSSFGIFYAASLWLALLTTGLSIVFVFRQRYGKSLLPALLLTLIFPQGSFRVLVGHLYPVMGSLAVILWLPLFLSARGENERP